MKNKNEPLFHFPQIRTQAHDRNLSVGLRNDWEQLDELQASFDWALSEDCLFQGECEVEYYFGAIVCCYQLFRVQEFFSRPRSGSSN